MLAEFQSFVDKHEDVMFVYMGTENKKMFDPSWEDVPSSYDPTTKPWYIQAKDAQGTIWTKPYADSETGSMIVSVATPVYDNSNKFIGVVSIDITCTSLSNEMNSIKIGENGYPVLLDSDLKFITHKNTELIAKDIEIPEISEAYQSSDNGIIEYKVDGNNKFATFKKMESGWSVLAIMDNSEISTLTRPIMLTTLVLGLISLIIGFVVAVALARNFIKPIVSLESTMNKVKEGDLTVRADIHSSDEIGRMAGSFKTILSDPSSKTSFCRAVENTDKNILSNPIDVSITYGT